jgi:hypothetical protein
MTRTAPIVDWSDPEDPVVKLGLTLKCGACKAEPGIPCTNTVNGQPLITLGRIIHFYRLDKSMKTTKEDT